MSHGRLAAASAAGATAAPVPAAVSAVMASNVRMRDFGTIDPFCPGVNPVSAVAGGDDARLDRVVGRVRGVAGHHGAFVERALAQVGVVGAAVAAAAEHDRAL